MLGGRGNSAKVEPSTVYICSISQTFGRRSFSKAGRPHRRACQANRKIPTLPFNWIIERDRFDKKGSSDPTHVARKIGTHLAPPILDLVNEGNNLTGTVQTLIKHLAQRNLGFCRESGTETRKDPMLMGSSCGEQIELLRE